MVLEGQKVVAAKHRHALQGVFDFVSLATHGPQTPKITSSDPNA